MFNINTLNLSESDCEQQIYNMTILMKCMCKLNGINKELLIKDFIYIMNREDEKKNEKD